jgi:outer membrane receptor protein involved in Fe transport
VLGQFQQSAVRDSGYANRKVQAYGAVIKAKLGDAELTSVTGYGINQVADTVDYSISFYPYTLTGIPGTDFNGFAVAGTPLYEDSKTTKWTQEVRLSLPLGTHLDFLAGAFYAHESTAFLQQFKAADSLTGATVGLWGAFDYPTTYTEYALFTDLTWKIAERFNVQFGARAGRNRQTYSEVDTGPYVVYFEGLASPLTNPEVRTRDHSLTYLVTPQLRISPDLMLYARFASGYRPGGPNPTCIVLHVPCQYAPDKTNNAELGIKGDWWNHALSIDASLYTIDWKDIQLTVIDPATNFNYFTNASRARSRGVEISLQARPLRGLQVGLWLAVNDAKLTKDLPANSPAQGFAGERLPDSSRYSGNLSLQESFPLGNRVTGFMSGTLSYVGNRAGVFVPPLSVAAPLGRQTFPGYARLDLQGGAKFDSWSISGFVKNAANRRAVLNGGAGTVPDPSLFNYIEPRSVGVSCSKSF